MQSEKYGNTVVLLSMDVLIFRMILSGLVLILRLNASLSIFLGCCGRGSERQKQEVVTSTHFNVLERKN